MSIHKHIEENTNCATRKASELSLELFNKKIDNLVGGSADLTGSNNTKTSKMKIITKKNFTGQYIYYGVREHAMGSREHTGLIFYRNFDILGHLKYVIQYEINQYFHQNKS